MNVPAPLTVADLDRMQCARNGCESHGKEHVEVYLHARCHPKAALSVAYSGGVLEIICSKCVTGVCQIAVASAT